MGLAKRHILVLLAHLGFVMVYALRVNLSVALIAMVTNDGDVTTNQTRRGNETGHNNSKAGIFHWDRELQGLILSSFFYGYLFGNIPGGWLANKYGGKWVLGGGILWSSVLTLLTPLAATSSPYLLVALRVLMGLGQGVTFPALFALIGKWTPSSEISRTVVFSQSGSSTGTIFTLPIASLLCDSDFLDGWPSAFYVFGILGIVWFVVWGIFISNSPDEHVTISDEEKAYILQSKCNAEPTLERAVPWLQIFTSIHVWAIMVAHFSHNWIWFLVLTDLPSYFSSVLQFNIREAGLLSSLPYVVGFMGYISGGILADFLIKKQLSVTTTRKLIASVALYSVAVFVILAGYSPPGDHTVPVTSMIVGVGLLCTNHGGTMTNHLDIAPNYGSVLLGLTNTAGTLSGCIAPLVTGYFTKTEPSRENYQKVFLLAGCISIVGGIFYGVFGTGVKQPWNDATSVHVTTPVMPIDTCMEKDDVDGFREEITLLAKI